jgi:antitoxin Xre/MbcA/ParS-like protein
MANETSTAVTPAIHGPLDHYWSAFFLLGLLVVAAYAWQRFNEPSFPNQKALPHTVAPLRYLFLKPAYQRARCLYLFVTLLLYCLLVAPGPSMSQVIGVAGAKDFPAEGWALLVALVLTGVSNASSSLKWLNMIEEQLRRWVHAWFFVPDGIERTIAVLEDASYDPPAAQLNLVTGDLRDRLQDDLKSPPGTTRHRRARATMLIASLRQMGQGPLKRSAFEPFQDDFDAIRTSFRALPRENDRTDDDSVDNLSRSIDDLLRRIYAYISWGLRSQANSEEELDRTLEKLGFRVPERGGRRVFDIVAPAAGLVAAITIVFWLTFDSVSRAVGASAPTVSQSVVFALTSAVGASLMYGLAAFIAFNRRADEIEQKVWQEASPECLIPIAVRCGLVTWIVIMVTTVLGQLPQTGESVTGIAHLIGSFAGGGEASRPTVAEWDFLPIRLVTALPWLLAGATVSVILAWSIGGDVRRTDMRERVRDAIILGIGLGVAVAAAQLIQISLTDGVFGEKAQPLGLVPIIGLAGAACGAVIGFMVPYACRTNIVTPLDPMVARDLRYLLGRAEVAFGSKDAANNWVFMPNNELGGITPAEAVQFKTHATGVHSLLDNQAPRIREEVRPDQSDRPISIAVDGKVVPIVPAPAKSADSVFAAH